MPLGREAEGGHVVAGDAEGVPERPAAGLAGPLLAVVLFSALVNLLMLTGPLYMLQVYDRVLSSQSIETLVLLTILMMALYGFMGAFDSLRLRVAARIGAILQARLGPPLLAASIDATARAPDADDPAGRGLDALDAIRRLLGSPLAFAPVDVPWTPMFLAVIFLLHPWLGVLALGGALVLIALSVLAQRLTQGATAAEARAMRDARNRRDEGRRGAETLAAMGMAAALAGRFGAAAERGLVAQIRGADLAARTGATARAMRFVLQSLILGLGALLVIRGAIGPGAMIAASILLGRALAPIDQAVTGWPAILAGLRGWRRLCETCRALAEPDGARRPLLAGPAARLEVRDLVVVPPAASAPALQGIGFVLEPGRALGVIGTSGAGKSALARALAGIWPPARGSVLLGGWPVAEAGGRLGPAIGYVPQRVELFEGTVAENIARMGSPDPVALADAVADAGAEAAIQALPSGLDTRLGPGGAGLSGGQAQRVALARALYGRPALVILDEPNAHLDAEGSDALNAAIRGLKRRGAAVVVMTHRPAGLAECDTVLVLKAGRMQTLGPRDAVLRAVVMNHPAIAPAIAPAREDAQADPAPNEPESAAPAETARPAAAPSPRAVAGRPS